MKTIAISKFKTHALRIIDEIAKSHESIVITRRGKPVAELISFRNSKDKPVPGKLAHTFVAEEDIVTPLGEDLWDVCK